MIYYRVEVESHRRGEWVAFIPEGSYTVTATSRDKLKVAVREHLERELGATRYEVIWLG